ncbi:hypothetical protein HK098_003005, partial [Nowakowskiella sp. JEL0407]
YRENARTLLIPVTQQLSNPNAKDPIAQNQKSQHDRELAFEYFYSQMLAKGGKRETKKFESLYKSVVGIGGFRETHKFTLIRVVDLIRKEVLSIGEKLAKEKILAERDQVFDLNFADLEAIISRVEISGSSEGRRVSTLDGSIDGSKLRAMRLQIWSRWDSYAKSGKELPRIIDTKTAKKTLVGYPVCAGVFEGRIKILSRPDENPLLPGEILVARCTNPGWTPLFINASAVMLEYGIPAVAGLVGMMDDSRLKDGVLVRVDVNAGYVTILEL